jgi:enamine deaminase RidA (YjgF/YER057c/UK114 family)
VPEKRGLGKVVHAGREMVWGKGAVAGGFVFLSGAEARADDTDEPVEGVAAQTELALERIRVRLEEAGARLDDVVKFVWYLTDRALEQEFYAARDGWLARHAPTLLEERSYASTLLIVGLAKPDMLVEIDCIAYLGSEESRRLDRSLQTEAPAEPAPPDSGTASGTAGVDSPR